MWEMAARGGVKTSACTPSMAVTPPRSAEASLAALEKGAARADDMSICGALRCDGPTSGGARRARLRLIAEGRRNPRCQRPEGLRAAYARGENDESVKPTAVPAGAAPPHERRRCGCLHEFPADRAREMTALTAPVQRSCAGAGGTLHARELRRLELRAAGLSPQASPTARRIISGWD
jgi:hypothetical protein